MDKKKRRLNMSEIKGVEEIKCPECEEHFKSKRSVGLHRSKKHNYKRAKKMSRADRAGVQADHWSDIANQVSALLDDGIEDNDGNEDENKKNGIVVQAKGLIEGIESSELENLISEISSWRDNMQGTNLENSQKYSDLEDCISTLEGIDVSSISIEDFDDIEQAVEELQTAADEVRSIEFPGMF